MANLIPTDEPSGIDWTLKELDSYNIRLEHQEAPEFFGVSVLPDPAVDAEVLQHLKGGDMKEVENNQLVNLMDMAMVRNRSGESAVVDFVVQLLRCTGYDYRHRVARRRVDLPLLVCGELRSTRMDVSLVKVVNGVQGDILLLVQEDKQLEDAPPRDARSQLVANALAAFTESNERRISSKLPPLESKVMPGIVMDGTAPTFFKIPVTQELVAHVQHGTYPPAPTVVTYCSPPVPHPDRLRIDGMMPLSNRRPILSCFEAFKSIIDA